MTIDLEELKRLAQAANEWRVRSAQPDYDPGKEAEAFGMDRKGAESLRWNHVSAFTSAATPAAVLALIGRVEMTTRERDSARATGALLEKNLRAMRSGRDAAEARVAKLEALARNGLAAYHGTKCLAGRSGQEGGEPKSCWDPTCRQWAAALEAK